MDQYSPRRISKALWDNNIHTPPYGRNKLCCLFIFMKIDPFFYYFMINKALNLRLQEFILVQLDQYSPRKISKSLWDNNIHTPQDRRKILSQLFISMELEPLFYYCVISKTLNTSQEKQKLVQLDQYSTIKIPKYLCDKDIHTPHVGRKLLCYLFIFVELDPFP